MSKKNTLIYGDQIVPPSSRSMLTLDEKIQQYQESNNNFCKNSKNCF